jgi:hypothetical protein
LNHLLWKNNICVTAEKARFYEQKERKVFISSRTGKLRVCLEQPEKTNCSNFANFPIWKIL